jgi:hypothetical protein
MTDSGLRSRADEVKLVLAALSEQGFDDVEPKDAEAILRTAVQVVMQRDWWLVVFRTAEGMEIPQGLFATEGAALKVAKQNLLGGLSDWQVRVVHVNNAEKQLQRVRIL